MDNYNNMDNIGNMNNSNISSDIIKVSGSIGMVKLIGDKKIYLYFMTIIQISLIVKIIIVYFYMIYWIV